VLENTKSNLVKRYVVLFSYFFSSDKQKYIPSQIKELTVEFQARQTVEGQKSRVSY
jgi:hypothetical protein